jgi:hypothetical protein
MSQQVGYWAGYPQEVLMRKRVSRKGKEARAGSRSYCGLVGPERLWHTPQSRHSLLVGATPQDNSLQTGTSMLQEPQKALRQCPRVLVERSLHSVWKGEAMRMPVSAPKASARIPGGPASCGQSCCMASAPAPAV